MQKFRELLFTAFYSGYFPKAPGTAGTVVGMALYFLQYLVFGTDVWISNLVIVLLMIYPSIKLGDDAEKFYGKKDPQEVVLDEVMGYWITMLFIPFDWKLALIGFVLFRIFDIIKPYPINKLEKLNGGLGIMIDDYIAGVYANIVLWGVYYLSVVKFGIL